MALNINNATVFSYVVFDSSNHPSHPYMVHFYYLGGFEELDFDYGVPDTSQTSHFDNGNYLSLGLGSELSLVLVS